MYTNAIKFLAFVAVVGAMLSAGDARAAGKYLYRGIAIRGIGPNAHCDAATLVPADNLTGGRASNLSVSCTEDTNTIGDYQRYVGGLLHNRYCVGKIAVIVDKQGSVKTQRTTENRYHCLVNGITPTDLAKSLGSCRVVGGNC